MKGKIFNAQEVQAMLNGSKLMFREVIKPRQPRENRAAKLRVNKAGNFVCMEWKDEPDLRIKGFGTDICKCPYQVGQKIFCKESFFINSFNQTMFKATFDYCSKRFSRLKDLYHDKSAKWKPAQHMKQEHSRLTLLIKEIKVERLAGISEEDAIKEGNYLDRCKCLPCKKDKSPIDAMFKQNWCHIHGQEFKHAWNATHKKPEEKFEASPFVWVVSFEVINN